MIVKVYIVIGIRYYHNNMLLWLFDFYQLAGVLRSAFHKMTMVLQQLCEDVKLT